MRRVNGWLTVFWVVMIPISYRERLAEQRHLRLGPLALGARLRALVDLAGCARRGHQQQEDIASDVVDAVIDKTDIERT